MQAQAPARPTPAPAPRVAQPAPPAPIHVAAGTLFELETLDDLSSGTSRIGDPIRARFVSDLMAAGKVVIPAGTAVEGTVTDVVPLKKIGGQPQLMLRFERVLLSSGATVPIRASLAHAGKKQAGRDAAKIAGGAAAGAVVGHQVDDDRGSIVGAIVGGAIGTAVASKTGGEVEMPAGTLVSVPLEDSIEVPVLR
jgi:hypothetical protein